MFHDHFIPWNTLAVASECCSVSWNPAEKLKSRCCVLRWIGDWATLYAFWNNIPCDNFTGLAMASKRLKTGMLLTSIGGFVFPLHQGSHVIGHPDIFICYTSLFGAISHTTKLYPRSTRLAHDNIRLNTWVLKIRGGFYADSAMYKHSAIANTTAQGPVRSQDTKGGVLFSVLQVPYT